VIGAINLLLEESTGLREKTNREGFDETEVFERFQRIVTSIVHKFEVERALDKDRLKNLLDGKTPSATKVPVETTLQELRNAVISKQGEAKLLPLIDRVEQEYYEMRDLLLRAGLTGLNLGMVIHEVERGIRGLYESAKGGATALSLEKNSRDLMGLVENVAGLLRNKTRGPIDLRKIIQNSAEINVRRYRRHQIKVTYELPELEMKLTGSPGLMQNVLLNLIDNSIYWLRVRWPDVDEGKAEVRRLHICISTNLSGGFSIIVSDNGPGFSDVSDVVTKPFFTRRPDGIGLGLYYASLSMSLSGGSLLFPDRDELDLPEGLDGAVVAMFFPGPNK
jgi:signal transduction histidine kinase